MTGRRITREHLGPEATEHDVEQFEAAVDYYVETTMGWTREMAEEYLWGNGDYIRRIPAHLLD